MFQFLQNLSLTKFSIKLNLFFPKCIFFVLKIMVGYGGFKIFLLLPRCWFGKQVLKKLNLKSRKFLYSVLTRVFIMSQTLKNEVISLVESLPKYIFDGEEMTYWESDISLNLIEKYEQKYNLFLPEYYKWFILKYETMYMDGDYIKTIFPLEEHDLAGESDIFANKSLDDKLERIAKNEIDILNSNGEVRAFFRINQDNIEDEVYYQVEGNKLEIFENFLIFLIVRIKKGNYKGLV